MDHYGFIRQKVDIKVLVLYILKHLPTPVDGTMLLELTMCDNAISYFDYMECLSEMQVTGHITELNNTYQITDFGRETLAEMEGDLPFTIRRKAGASAQRAAKILSREALIQTSHERKPDDSADVLLALNDENGQIMKLEIHAGSEEQAKQMEKRFRENAEALYLRIAGILTGE